MTSLTQSATLPATPVQASGMRAVKSPSRTWASTPRRVVVSMASRVAVAVSDMVGSPVRAGRGSGGDSADGCLRGARGRGGVLEDGLGTGPGRAWAPLVAGGPAGEGGGGT